MQRPPRHERAEHPTGSAAIARARLQNALLADRTHIRAFQLGGPACQEHSAATPDDLLGMLLIEHLPGTGGPQ